MRDFLGLVGWIGLTFVAATIGMVASVQAQVFYGQLTLPSWAPPAGVFGPAWTFLYILMGVAAWLVWRHGGFASNQKPLTLFLIQLFFNALWSWLFFAWKLGFWSFIDIVVLLSLVLATLISFWRVKPLAGALLLPYLLWISFASMLNYSTWQLNTQILG